MKIPLIFKFCNGLVSLTRSNLIDDDILSEWLILKELMVFLNKLLYFWLLGNYPYWCKECKKGFVVQTHYKEHQAKHEVKYKTVKTLLSETCINLI